MSLWVDKYRPTTLAKLDYHLEQAEDLRNMVQKRDFPHLLVHGPPGAGKKTRILCILKELYGSAAERVKVETVQFETASKKKLEILTMSSNYHTEVNPSDAGLHDRIVIMELIKATAQTHHIDIGQKEFKVVLLSNVDQLTRDAQHALRRTMEKYISTCRLILCANSTSRVLPAIQSRCVRIRVPAPTVFEIKTILHLICKREGLNIPDELINRVIEASNRNLRRAILMLEACKVEQYPFTTDQKVTEPDWQIYIRNTASMMVSEQSPKILLDIRNRFYDLLTRAVPCDLIFRGLLQECIKKCDDQLKKEIIGTASEYQHRMIRGSKPIFHLEAFAARFMAVYKKYIESSLESFM
ncbi:replication factor C subunit 3 [Linepithema humile]|uniref:replication factor C subunit 3 n=1 Tax=Linepithema humile TaxID=83485 RepID=UPI000623AC5F|nr:PREDICTED: replication factor C subunit 3 [Linepithema humile]